MHVDKSNGRVTFIPSSPSFLEIMVVDERDGEVARAERERYTKGTSVISSRVRGVSCEGVEGGMIERSRDEMLEEDWMEETQIMGEMVVGEDVTRDNTLLGKGIFKGEGVSMLGHIVVLGPTKEEVETPELVIKIIGETRELLVAVEDVGGNYTSSSLVDNPLSNFCLSALFVSSSLASPVLISPVCVWDEGFGFAILHLLAMPKWHCLATSSAPNLSETQGDNIVDPWHVLSMYRSIDDRVEVGANWGDILVAFTLQAIRILEIKDSRFSMISMKMCLTKNSELCRPDISYNVVLKVFSSVN
eukprot:Gb_15466 [translate_table: standard]